MALPDSINSQDSFMQPVISQNILHCRGILRIRIRVHRVIREAIHRLVGVSLAPLHLKDWMAFGRHLFLFLSKVWFFVSWIFLQDSYRFRVVINRSSMEINVIVVEWHRQLSSYYHVKCVCAILDIKFKKKKEKQQQQILDILKSLWLNLIFRYI